MLCAGTETITATFYRELLFAHFRFRVCRTFSFIVMFILIDEREIYGVAKYFLVVRRKLIKTLVYQHVEL